VLATVRREMGYVDSAERLLRQGFATLTRLAVGARLNPDAPPPKLIKEWGNLKLVYSQLQIDCDRYEEAEVLLRKSLATLAALPACADTAHQDANLTMQLARVLHDRRDLLGAEKLYRELLPKFQGKANFNVVAQNLGLVLRDRGLVTESRKYLNIAQQANTAGYGADNSRTLQALRARSKLEVPLRTCARCGPVTDEAIVMKICQGCKAARYCSPACAGLHWKAHKKECRRIKAENEQIAGGAGPSTDGSAGPSGE